MLKSVYQGRGLQIDSEVLADTDMAGPLVFCLALGGALLLVRARPPARPPARATPRSQLARGARRFRSTGRCTSARSTRSRCSA